MTKKAGKDVTQQEPAVETRSKAKSMQSQAENPITAAPRPRKGLQKLVPGKTRFGRKSKTETGSDEALREMAVTPSKPNVAAQPVTRATKRKLLDVIDFNSAKKQHLQEAAKPGRRVKPRGQQNPQPASATKLVIKPSSDGSSPIQEIARSETPEHRYEGQSAKGGTFLKQLLRPVYTLFRGEKGRDSSTSSQETSPVERQTAGARSCSKSLRSSESPENLPDCDVNTLPVSERERQQSRAATPELTAQDSQTEEAELDSNDEEETSIRLLQDRLASQRSATDTGGLTVPDYSDEEEEEEEDYLDDIYDPYLFIKILPPLESSVPPWRKCLLPKQKLKRKTLVLDLDETLVHTELKDGCSPDSWFKMMIGSSMKYVCVGKRPHLDQFLEKCAELYEVVVFTASLKHYADAVIDRIDPTRKLVQHRLFRDSCLQLYGNYMKDLSALGRDLSQTIIIDNSPQAYGYQLSNGIPIESWYDDKNDTELLKMSGVLETLAGVPDVRPVIRETFETHKLVEAATLPSPSPQLEADDVQL